MSDGERTPDVRRAVLPLLSEIKSNRVEDKVLEVARNGESFDLRRQAIRLLGERTGELRLDFLSATVQNDSNAEAQVSSV